MEASQALTSGHSPTGWHPLAPFRAVLLLLALLLPLNLPFSLPSMGRARTFGWSASTVRGSAGRPALIVTRVMRHAYAQGLMPGDRLVAVNGEPVDSAALARIRAQARAGDTLVLSVVRAGHSVHMPVSVLAGSAARSLYLWYRLALALLCWAVGLALVTWRGTTADVLCLGAALLLVPPITFPGGVPGAAAALATARGIWQLAAAGFRLFFPALVAHFLVLNAPRDSFRPAILRSERLWWSVYILLFLVLAGITDGFRDLESWATPGPAWQLRQAVGLLGEVGALGVALRVRRHADQVNGAVAWIDAAAILVFGALAALSALILTVGDGPGVELIWRLNGVALLALPLAAATLFVRNVALPRSRGAGSTARLRTRWPEGLLTALYGLAVAGAATAVSTTRQPGGGLQWPLFATVFLVAVAFSPALRWAHEWVERGAAARWAQKEGRVREIMSGLGAELEPRRIADRIASTLPEILKVADATLLFNADMVALWPAGRADALDVVPAARLEERLAHAAPGSSPTLLALRGPDGTLLGALRLDSESGDGAAPGVEPRLAELVAGSVASALQSAQAHMELEKAEKELAEAEQVASLGALAAGLAHEIKNPLAGLRMGIHVLEAGSIRSDRLERIRSDLQRIDDLVNGLLRYTRDTDTGPPSAVDLRRTVRECVADARPLAEDRRLSFVESYPVCVPYVLGGRDQLRLVVGNLLSNALAASPEGSTITVTLTCGDERVRLSVADEGPGIPAHVRRRMFDLNFSTKPYGSGLGLALARREVERMGGYITSSTTPAGGAVLLVSLARVLVDGSELESES